MTLKELVSAIVKEDNADARLKLMQDNVAMFETQEGTITQEDLDAIQTQLDETLETVDSLRADLQAQKDLYHDAFINGVGDDDDIDDDDGDEDENVDPSIDELLEEDLQEAREKKGIV